MKYKVFAQLDNTSSRLEVIRVLLSSRLSNLTLV